MPVFQACIQDVEHSWVYVAHKFRVACAMSPIIVPWGPQGSLLVASSTCNMFSSFNLSFGKHGSRDVTLSSFYLFNYVGFKQSSRKVLSESGIGRTPWKQLLQELGGNIDNVVHDTKTITFLCGWSTFSKQKGHERESYTLISISGTLRTFLFTSLFLHHHADHHSKDSD